MGKSPRPPGSYNSAFVGCPAALLLLPHPPRSGAALPEERRQRRLTGPRLVHPTLGADGCTVERRLRSFPCPLG